MNVFDGLKSLLGGLGDINRDKSAGISFEENTLDDQQLMNAYSSNWIARKIIDIPAEDSLRKWRRWESDNSDLIELEEQRLGLKAKVKEASIKGRMLGGAAIYIGTDQEPTEPLNPETIKKGGIKYLTVMTRRELTAGELEQDPETPYYGKPKDYTISSQRGQVTIHPSRLILFYGHELADIWTTGGAYSGWSESVLKATCDAIKQAGGTFANVASLVFEANVDVIHVPDMLQNLSSDEYEKRLLKRFTVAATAKGINRTLVLDGEEKYERKGATFTNLPELMEAFALYCAASEDIPATRFLGRSPAGMSATGEGDLNNYHDKLQAMQTLDYGPAMHLFDQCLVRSAVGSYPEGTKYEWTPLKQMTEAELAEIFAKLVEALKNLHEMHVYSGSEMRQIATHRLTEVGALPHLESLIDENVHVLGDINGNTLKELVAAEAMGKADAGTAIDYLINAGMYKGKTRDQVIASTKEEDERQQAIAVGMQ